MERFPEERYALSPLTTFCILNIGKGEDDGSLFSSFLKESRLPVQLRHVSWEAIRDILELYKVCLYPIQFRFVLIMAPTVHSIL